MYDFKTMRIAGSISLLAVDGQYSYKKGSSVFTNISSYQLKRFLDKDWDENVCLEELIEQINIDWSKGWLVIDDTMIEKPYSKEIEGVYWGYSSKNKGYELGITLTILAWTDGQRTIPLKMMIYEKDKEGETLETKNDFSVRAIQYAYEKGIYPTKVCFDSKYSSKKLLNLIHSIGWRYFCQLACNRLFNDKQLKTRRFQPYSEEGRLKGVGHRVNITKYSKRYYATNETGVHVTSQHIVKHYRVRWKIEELFRALKQLCHLEECKGRKLSSQRRYIALSIQAFLILQEQGETTVYRAKRVFQQKYLRLKLNGNKALQLLTA